MFNYTIVLEPCAYNTLLKDNWRIADFVTNASSNKCDSSLQKGWYRFQQNGANTTLATQCPQVMNVCGGKYPTWYNGNDN